MEPAGKPALQRTAQHPQGVCVGRSCLPARAAADFLFHGTRGAGENAPVFASLCLIVLSALLTALNVYDRIAKHAGAGTLVPITGFANSMVSAAMEFKTEGYILGLGAKMFSIAGPVIVYGISASVLYGLILMMIG